MTTIQLKAVPALALCAGVLACALPAAAEEVVKRPVTVDVSFGGELPKRLTFRGNVPQLVIDDKNKMTGSHTVEATYDLSNPHEITLIVTAMWADDDYDARQFDLLPSNTLSNVPVRFLTEGGPNAVLFEPFDEDAAKADVRTRCMSKAGDLDVAYFNYKHCFFLFSVFKTNSRWHFSAAFDALKGAFDQYYALLKEPNYPLARDRDIEREALEYEEAAATDPAVNRMFNTKRVSTGYFKGMVNQIGNVQVAPYAAVKKEAAAGQASSDDIAALQVETELLKGRFMQEQKRIQVQQGQLPAAINGITLRHLDDLSFKINGLNPL